MNDKLVTHEDRPYLRDMRATLVQLGYGPEGTGLKILDRLIAAAEADAPPLPEGWVLLVGDDGGLYPYWHEDNRLSNGNGKAAYKIEATAAALRDRLTPLRPTVTEADVEKAAHAIFVDRRMHTRFEGCIRDSYLDEARAAFTAASIEVRS